MPYISESIINQSSFPELGQAGFKLVYRGKVRDRYLIPVKGWEKLCLMVASDRVSVHDFVLGSLIPRKGEQLTMMSHMWFTKVMHDLPNHLPHEQFSARVLCEMGLLPWELLGRCQVVRTVEILPLECIYRMRIGGVSSVWDEYLKTGMVAGQQLPVGLEPWEKLPTPIFTPSTKAVEGHDRNLTLQEAIELVGVEEYEKYRDLGFEGFNQAYKYANSRGYELIDTKFEFGGEGFADEPVTCDSSRIVTHKEIQVAVIQCRDPQFLDKQYVRNAAKAAETPWGRGINGVLTPENPTHVRWVANWQLPEEVISATTAIYLELFEGFWGMSLDECQKQEFGMHGKSRSFPFTQIL